MEQETIEVYREPCDCGSHIRHNNGGNYHRITRCHVFYTGEAEKWCAVVERTTTREDFPREEFEALTFNGSNFEIVPDNDRWPREEPAEDEIVARFRYGEVRIAS